MARSADLRLDAVLARLRADAPSCAPFGSALYAYEEVESTNDIAQHLASTGAPEGTVVIAAAQRRGRGRRGASFVSPRGGLYWSTLLRPAAWPVEREVRDGLVGSLTLMAGVAVTHAARSLGAIAAELKWPNDVVVGGADHRLRKLAGVLAEGTADDRGLHHVVLGIGINVAATPADVGLGRSATSLRECVGHDLELAEVASALMTSLAGWFETLRHRGAAAIVEGWRQYAPSTAGRRVAWTDNGQRRTGVAVGIDAAGALEIADDAGLARIAAGPVEWEGYGH